MRIILLWKFFVSFVWYGVFRWGYSIFCGYGVFFTEKIFGLTSVILADLEGTSNVLRLRVLPRVRRSRTAYCRHNM